MWTETEDGGWARTGHETWGHPGALRWPGWLTEPPLPRACGEQAEGPDPGALRLQERGWSRRRPHTAPLSRSQHSPEGEAGTGPLRPWEPRKRGRSRPRACCGDCTVTSVLLKFSICLDQAGKKTPLLRRYRQPQTPRGPRDASSPSTVPWPSPWHPDPPTPASPPPLLMALFLAVGKKKKNAQKQREEKAGAPACPPAPEGPRARCSLPPQSHRKTPGPSRVSVLSPSHHPRPLHRLQLLNTAQSLQGQSVGTCQPRQSPQRTLRLCGGPRDCGVQ